MVLLLAKNSKAGCLFRPNFLKQVVIEIQKWNNLVKNFQSTTPGGGCPLINRKKPNFQNGQTAGKIFGHNFVCFCQATGQTWYPTSA